MDGIRSCSHFSQRVLQASKRSQYQKHWPSILIIESESDCSLISALKERFFKGAGDISVGDWIYYKNASIWKGLVKIHSQDGKLLYSVRANKLLTINSHHVMLAKADDVFGVRNEPVELSTEKTAT